jgi:hypothetical protein
MSCTLIIEEGNPAVLRVTVRNALTGAAINDATVTARVLNSSNTEVAGQSWPVSLSYVGGSAGEYRAQLESTLAVDAGQTYTAEFTITAGGVTRTLNYEVVVVTPGCGATPPPTSPASPAYRAPAALTLLNEAETQYHRLMLGLSPRVVVDQNGERIEYTAANAPRLAQYIAGLKMQLGLLPANNRGPAGAFF